jgi:predicted transcriptional regulator
MEDRTHVIHLLQQASEALKQNDPVVMKDLSNQTIHCASCVQDSGNIAVAVLTYALSKIIERRQHYKIKNWPALSKKISLYLESAAHELSNENYVKYEDFLKSIRASLEAVSNLKAAIAEVLRNAAINKASKLYEHGISLGQTANLLGITQWELSEYTGQRVDTAPSINQAFDARKRAQMALEFFS